MYSGRGQGAPSHREGEREFLFSILVPVTLNHQLKDLVFIIYNEVLFNLGWISEKGKLSVTALEHYTTVHSKHQNNTNSNLK